MDPLTLFALANGAVQAVKKGCELYKEIASAAGDVKGVLSDLEEQFNSRHKDKPPTIAEKNQYIEEKYSLRDFEIFSFLVIDFLLTYDLFITISYLCSISLIFWLNFKYS